jgi:hypothetical protein
MTLDSTIVVAISSLLLTILISIYRKKTSNQTVQEPSLKDRSGEFIVLFVIIFIISIAIMGAFIEYSNDKYAQGVGEKITPLLLTDLTPSANNFQRLDGKLIVIDAVSQGFGKYNYEFGWTTMYIPEKIRPHFNYVGLVDDSIKYAIVIYDIKKVQIATYRNEEKHITRTLYGYTVSLVIIDLESNQIVMKKQVDPPDLPDTMVLKAQSGDQTIAYGDELEKYIQSLV